MSTVFLGLGANLGDRCQNFKKAFQLLEKNPANKIKRMSSIYETEPIGVEEQPLFLNAVAEVETSLSPRQFLKFILEIENILGRTRETRYSPREIDLDILFFDDLIISEDDLVVPHPLISERAFVLVPLAELAPDFIHPVFKISLAELKEKVRAKEKVRPYLGEARE